jgi:flagellar assembly protein FliH
MILSRVITKAEESSAYKRWEMPIVDSEPTSQPTIVSAPTSTASKGDIEIISKQAHEEGFADGFANGFAQGQREGFAASKAELDERIASLDRLIGGVAESLKNLDEEVEQELTRLAVAMARQIVRREIKLDPGGIVTMVREAVNQLGPGARSVTLNVHPEDAVLLRDCLQANENSSTWRIVDDLSLKRGDCHVHSENSHIDATIDTRLAAIAVAALGGERREDDAGS